MNKKYISIGILTLVILATIGLSGCLGDDKKNELEIDQSNISMSINDTKNPLSLLISGNHVAMSIGSSVVLSSIVIQGNYCILRLSQSHKDQDFSKSDSALNTIIEYSD